MDVYKEWLGIPEGERPPNHYELLRLVQFEDDVDKVRAHYKKLNAHVRKYATGQYSSESQALLNELAKAMLCLTDPDRKRDYDESLGREFETESEELGRRPLLRVLADDGVISREQIREVEDFADARGLSNRDAVVQMKLASSEKATQALAVELGLPFVDLNDMLPDDSVLDRVPRGVVKRHSILPLFVDDDMLLVACVDQPDPELEDDLRLRFGMPMRGVLATPLSINQGIAKYYAPGMRDEVIEEARGDAEGKTEKGKKTGGQAAKGKKGSAKSPVKTWAQLSDEERYQKRQIGILIMCWVTIACVLLDQYVVLSYVFPGSSTFFMPLTFLGVPAAIFYVFKVFWK